MGGGGIVTTGVRGVSAYWQGNAASDLFAAFIWQRTQSGCEEKKEDCLLVLKSRKVLWQDCLYDKLYLFSAQTEKMTPK